jgi:hypothetical protein
LKEVPSIKRKKRIATVVVGDEPDRLKRTKTDIVIALLRRPSGATLQAIMKLTGWQAHSVRGFLSAQVGTRKGLKVESTKRKGHRVYRIVS